MRDILVYADSFETWSHGVEYAAALAASRSGSLTAAYVYPTPDYMMPAYGAPALLAEIVEQARRVAYRVAIGRHDRRQGAHR